MIEAGGTYQGRSLGLRKDGTSLHIEMRGTAFTYRGKPHVLAVTRDITDRVQAYELLEQRVAKRTRELSTVLGINRIIASTLDLPPLLRLFLSRLKTVADYDRASVAVVEDGHLVVLDARTVRL